jgi:hypothetical protein
MSRALARCLDVGWMLSPSVRVGVASRDSTHATRESRLASRESRFWWTTRKFTVGWMMMGQLCSAAAATDGDEGRLMLRAMATTDRLVWNCFLRGA